MPTSRSGNLTVTDERLKIVDFVAPDDAEADRRAGDHRARSRQPMASVDDLAGKTVHVRKASSYYESLVALNERLEKEGKRAVKLVLVPDALEDEDMMEMLDAGVLDVDRRRRLEGAHVGAGAAQDRGQRERASCAPAARSAGRSARAAPR